MSKRPSKTPPKMDNVKQVAADCLKTGHYRLAAHAIERQAERKITLMEIRQVLLSGRREPAKDKYNMEFAAWDYAMRGPTVDKRELRVVISFDEKGMLIITVIALREKN